MAYHIHSEVGRLRSILVKHVRDAFISQECIDRQWRDLNYTARPDYARALEEYEAFVDLVKRAVPDIQYLPQSEGTGLDSIYVRDAVLMTPKGAILCNMGKAARRGEPAAAADFLSHIGIPVIGGVTGAGRLEGGDVIWLDGETLAVGRGYRTNDEGIRQLGRLTADFAADPVVVPLPHWKGPGDVFHLMSIISPLDHDLAAVYSPLMPVPFREFLIGRGIQLLEVPDVEFASMACNILAVAPRVCIKLAGSPRTTRMLQDAGVEVWEYEGNEISRKGAGGPTCLTRPLHRAG